MKDNLTIVDCIYENRKMNYACVYSKPVRVQVIYRHNERSRNLHYFAPGARIFVDMWEANKYGTKYWRFSVARTLSDATQAEGILLPNTSLPVKILLDVTGAARCKAVHFWLKKMYDTGKLDTLSDEKFIVAHLHFDGMNRKELAGYVKENYYDI